MLRRIVSGEGEWADPGARPGARLAAKAATGFASQPAHNEKLDVSFLQRAFRKVRSGFRIRTRDRSDI
jgi:hypothetical protein